MYVIICSQIFEIIPFITRWIKAYKSHVYVKATLQDFPSHAPMISTKEAIRHLNIREADEQPKHLSVCADVTWFVYIIVDI